MDGEPLSLRDQLVALALDHLLEGKGKEALALAIHAGLEKDPKRLSVLLAEGQGAGSLALRLLPLLPPPRARLVPPHTGYPFLQEAVLTFRARGRKKLFAAYVDLAHFASFPRALLAKEAFFRYRDQEGRLGQVLRRIRELAPLEKEKPFVAYIMGLERPGLSRPHPR